MKRKTKISKMINRITFYFPLPTKKKTEIFFLSFAKQLFEKALLLFIPLSSFDSFFFVYFPASIKEITHYVAWRNAIQKRIRVLHHNKVIV
nr:uncharacterized protein SPBC36.13 [Schizosaccharomyces pombe]G2TRS4.1 RecName: Full=Putative uncharacterized protein SPBC36.13 [Schizosaccharomyces pombe 972h-]CCD31355.1 dubious [Schizosaccharomyces pombe]|eukprot:NP_001343145.1 uncharacterized protein SPBC36.13 [Schizosaccharomyces pombe]